MKINAQDIQDNLFYKSKNEINLKNVAKETPIYRVFPIQRLLELFFERKNVLVKPELWDDPFENVLFQQTVKLKNDTPVYLNQIREKFYGQCWTLTQEETDALWRIYSTDKLGVRVKTTISKLWDSYYDPSSAWAQNSYHIGRIEYLKTHELKVLFENSDTAEHFFDFESNGPAKTLLMKRIEFKHENEIRLLHYANDTEKNSKSKIYKYSIDPFELIDELLFDPRFDDACNFNLMKTIIQDLGFNKKIEKSELYQLPELNMRLNH